MASEWFELLAAAVGGGGILSAIVNNRHKKREQERDQKHAKEMAALTDKLDDEASARKMLRELHLPKRAEAAKELGWWAHEVIEQLEALRTMPEVRTQRADSAVWAVRAVERANAGLDQRINTCATYTPVQHLAPFRALLARARSVETAGAPVREVNPRGQVIDTRKWTAIRDTWIAQVRESFDMDEVRTVMDQCGDALRSLVGAHLVRELDASPEPKALAPADEDGALPAAADESKALKPTPGG